MEPTHARLRILDAALFWRKLVLLVVFSLLFLPLKYYRLDRFLEGYIVLLLVLHVYFVFVLVFRVRWNILAEHRRSFLLRLLAVALFIALLARQSTGATFADFALFLAVSLVIHAGLLLSLAVVVRAETPTPAPSAP